MMGPARPLGAALAIALPLIAAGARADDAAPPEQKAAAQVLFEEGRSLVEQGRFAEACPKLAESERLDPGIGTMLWLGDCYENADRTASAWVMFKQAAGAAAARHDEREHVARERAAQIEARLTRLTISVAAEQEHLEVRRDGVLVGSAEWGMPIPVDPGSHTVSAEAPGRRKWTTTVELARGPQATEVAVPALEAEESPARATAAAAQPVVMPRPPSNDASTGNAMRIAGASIASAGLVAVAAGTFFAFRARSTYDESNSSGHCLKDNECDATGLKNRNDAFSMATVATVGIGLGAAALVGGAVLFFAAPHKEATVTIAPSTQGASVRYQIAW
jgi:serine/threonine-protein kinase